MSEVQAKFSVTIDGERSTSLQRTAVFGAFGSVVTTAAGTGGLNRASRFSSLRKGPILMHKIFRLALAGVVLLAGVVAGGAADAAELKGSNYGTRDPKTCPSRKEPTNGAPSAAQAATYFHCSMEYYFGDKLVLVENVKVEVGSGRKFMQSDAYLKEVDPQYMIYPIRGDFDKYFCSPVTGRSDTAAPNCLLSKPRNAKGFCWRTGFAEWRCEMSDNTSINDVQTVRGPK